jgi:hypothetical protein
MGIVGVRGKESMDEHVGECDDLTRRGRAHGKVRTTCCLNRSAAVYFPHDNKGRQVRAAVWRSGPVSQ